MWSRERTDRTVDHRDAPPRVARVGRAAMTVCSGQAAEHAREEPAAGFGSSVGLAVVFLVETPGWWILAVPAIGRELDGSTTVLQGCPAPPS